MSAANSSTLTTEQRLSCAQAAYREYSTRCFWFMDENLVITEENLPLVVEGLKLHGGHKG